MKEREILERVANHFSQPGVKTGWDSVRRMCVYKSGDGGLCAIGCLVSPEWAKKVANVAISDLTKERPFDSFFDCRLSMGAMLSTSKIDKAWVKVLDSLYAEIGTRNHAFLEHLQELHDEWVSRTGSTDGLVNDIRTLLNGGEFEFNPNWVIREARGVLSDAINKK
jgi:hypothetical protein